jgi:two-component system, response regulator PdtaR
LARRRTILLVEDEPLIRLDLAITLRNAGFTVIEARRAEDAVELLSSSPAVAADLLLTDVNLGGMTGLELAKWVLSNRPNFPIAVMSGASDALEHARTVVPNTSLIFAKPIPEQRLLQQLRRLFDALPPMNEDKTA